MTTEEIIRKLNGLPANAQAQMLEDILSERCSELRMALRQISELPLTGGPASVAMAIWIAKVTQIAKTALDKEALLTTK